MLDLRLWAPVTFLLAFGWAGWMSWQPLSRRHVSTPNLPALAGAGRLDRLEPIPAYLLREGEWLWAAGGRMFTLPDAIAGLQPFRELQVGLTPDHGDDYPSLLCAAAAWTAHWWGLQAGLTFHGESEGAIRPANEILHETLRDALDRRLEQPWTSADDRTTLALELVDILRRAAAAPMEPDGESPAPGPADEGLARYVQSAPPLEIIGVSPGQSLSAPERAFLLGEALRRHGPALVLAHDRPGGLRRGAPTEASSLRPGVLIGEYSFEGSRLFLLRIPGGLSGGPADDGSEFALASPDLIAGAWAFPHPLHADIKAEGGRAFVLQVRDPWGRPLPVQVSRELRLSHDGAIRAAGPGQYRIELTAPRGYEEAMVSVSRQFYMSPSGPATLALRDPERALPSDKASEGPRVLHP